MILDNKELKIIIGKNVPETDAPVQSTEEDKQELLYNIAKAISEGGYNPVSQIVGYMISDDPTHISNYNNARTLMSRLDRDELLEDMVKSYLEMLEKEYGADNEEDND